MRNMASLSIASRTIAACLAGVVSLAVGVAIAAQQPRITNGQIAPRQAASPFAQSVRALVAGQTDAAWIGYAVPVVDGERIMCCFGGDTTFVNGTVSRASGQSHACRLEPSADGTSMARRSPVAPNTGVVTLDRSDRMIVLIRAVNRDIDRVRVFSEDCELDAGGRQVIWLNDVGPADSVALLESVAVPAEGRRDRVSDGAITAIALHGDPSADASLERLVAPSQPEARAEESHVLARQHERRARPRDLEAAAEGGPQRRGPEGRGVRRLAEPRARRVRHPGGNGAIERKFTGPERSGVLGRPTRRRARLVAHSRITRARQRAGSPQEGGVRPEPTEERRRRRNADQGRANARRSGRSLRSHLLAGTEGRTEGRRRRLQTASPRTPTPK